MLWISNHFFNFRVDVRVGEQDATNFSYRSKDAPEYSTSFDINVVRAAGEIFWMENSSKIENYRVLNCVVWCEIKFTYLNDNHNSIYTLGDFENKTPAFMASTQFPVTSSNCHFIFWVTLYQREKSHFIPVTSSQCTSYHSIWTIRNSDPPFQTKVTSSHCQFISK